VIRFWLLIGLALSISCGPATPPAAAPNAAAVAAARIERVLNGLRPGIVIEGEAPVRWTLAERMAFHKVPGLSVAVIDSGRIVWARGFGVKAMGGTDSVTTETLFQAGSISKPTFALGLMRLVQDGRLNLDEDVNLKLTSWKVPENRFTAKEKVTLRRILSHNAGLTVHGFPGYEAGTPVPTVVQLLNGTKPANTAAVRVDTFPGAISRYSGGGTTVAQLLTTDVTGKPFPQLMQELVLGPAGMTRSTFEQPLPPALAPTAATGTYGDGRSVPGQFHTYPEMAAAGLWTTASDLATLAIELQQTWAGQSEKVVSKATLTEMFTVQKEPFGIGYQIEGTGADLAFQHNGADEGFQAVFIAFAERGQGFIAMANSDNGSQVMNELTAAVADEYGWPSHQPRRKTVVARDPATLGELAGEYSMPGGAKPVPGTVTLEAGKLFFEVPGVGLAKTELLADSDSTFFARSSGMPVQFEKDPAGKVVGINVAGGVRGKKVK
jgi:CubicO group peptidase (beta-lactamase class C family)